MCPLMEVWKINLAGGIHVFAHFHLNQSMLGSIL